MNFFLPNRPNRKTIEKACACNSIMTRNLPNHLFFIFILSLFYPPDSQESDGGANT